MKTENTKSTQMNLVAELLDDLTEYLDFRLRQIQRLNNVDEQIDAASRQIRNVLYNPKYEDGYVNIPFVYPCKIQELRE